MALRFAKTAWIKWFFWLKALYRSVDYGTSAEIQQIDRNGKETDTMVQGLLSFW